MAHEKGKDVQLAQQPEYNPQLVRSIAHAKKNQNTTTIVKGRQGKSISGVVVVMVLDQPEKSQVQGIEELQQKRQEDAIACGRSIQNASILEVPKQSPVANMKDAQTKSIRKAVEDNQCSTYRPVQEQDVEALKDGKFLHE